MPVDPDLWNVLYNAGLCLRIKPVKKLSQFLIMLIN